MTAEVDALIAERIEDWRRRLIDLTYRNRLINYKPTKASTIEVEKPALDELLADPGRAQPWRFYFPPEPDEGTDNADGEREAADFVDEMMARAASHGSHPRQSDEIVVRGETSPRRVSRLLENLARKSNLEFQDKALRILYIAAGFLDWVDPVRNQPLSSPLVLVPVELRRQTASEPYQLYFVDDEPITVNPSLTEKLRRDLSFGIPAEWVWEDKPIAEELAEIEGAVAGHGWNVRPDAALSLFSFQKFVMYRDLLDNEKRISLHPAVISLARKRLAPELDRQDVEVPALADLDDAQPPESDFSILDADATQRRCIEAARRGQSFVMRGPPGTGKSQTIANIISQAIGSGQRVLFVSEKAAALDVVYKRLSAQGLDEFCLLLHGEHSARREVVEALHHSLTGELKPRSLMASHELERLQKLRELLNSTAELLHLPMPLLGNRSLRDVLGELAQLHDAPSLQAAPVASEARGRDALEEFQNIDELFQRLGERWRVSPKSFAWRSYAGAQFTTDDRGRVLMNLERLEVALRLLQETDRRVATAIGWPTPSTLRATDSLIALADHLEAAPGLGEHWVIDQSAADVQRVSTEARTMLEAYTAALHESELSYPNRGLDEFHAGSPDELRESVDQLGRVLSARKGWDTESLIGLREWRQFLESAPESLSEIEDVAGLTARALGQPTDGLTLDTASRLARLADEAFRGDDRPERDWLVGAGLARASEALEELGPSLLECQGRRAKLLESYEDSVLDLDATGIRTRFEDQYGSIFARLSSAYRADVKAIRAVRKDRKLPREITAELAEISTVQELQRTVEAQGARLTRAWGSYFSGLSTDLDRISAALSTAQRIASLSDSRADLDTLARKVAVDSTPDPNLAQLADRTDAAVRQVRSGLAALRPTADVVATIERQPIGELREGLTAIGEAVERVLAAVGPFEIGAAAPPMTLVEARRAAELVRRGHETRDAVRARTPEWERLLAPYFRGPDSPWSELDRAAAWLADFEELVGDQVPETLAALLGSPERRWPDFEGLRTARASFASEGGTVAQMFEAAREQELTKQLPQMHFGEVSGLADDLRSTVDDLHDWTEFRAARDKACAKGWGHFVEAMVHAELAAQEVVGAFRKAFWNRRLEALFAEEKDLADTGSTYARWIAEFRELDLKLVRSGADRLIAAWNRHRKPLVALPGSHVALLRDEAAKRRRHRPVRVLLSQLGPLLPQLKPCLLMSPLTVSSFLSPTQEFDLVVFDEASQVPPQDAINCIYRGKQLIVAGDNRQLPPTPFFQVSETEETWGEESADVTEEMESVLDSCDALLPQHPLRWHYRSRHESLIAFSNHHVYDGSLVTFPSADEFSPRKGVRFIPVPNGVYERGRGVNRVEARVVAERVFEHLRADRRSIGVITFNSPQQTAVSEEIERLRIGNPEFEARFSGDRLDNIFVKNLESVQGDERDVIIFSIGFGRDASGKFTMNFGPLNKDGGYRRLNVAVTRARELVEVVSSVRAADFSLSEGVGKGPILLRDYIRYAELNGELPELVERGSGRGQEKLEASIASVVRSLGYSTVSNVGSGTFGVDVGVREASEHDYALGIVTDGDSYRAIPTARDRERLREAVLRDLSWRLCRVWSLDWVRNRQKQLQAIREALDEDPPDGRGEAAKLSPSPTQRSRDERPVLDLRGAAQEGLLDWVKPYESTELPSQWHGYEFHESAERDRQTKLLLRLLEVEAPVHVEYAIRRVSEAWGVRRVTDRVLKAGRIMVNMGARQGLVEKRGQFLWRPGQAIDAVRIPESEVSWRRDISEIAPEEIDLAFVKLIDMRGKGAGPKEELIVDVARLLGFDRVGPNIRSVLLKRLRKLGRDEPRQAEVT
jgi:hypothetical protein